MKRNWRPVLALVLAGGLGTPAAEKPAAQKPNIIIILSDDVGLGNIGCWRPLQDAAD